MFALESVIVVGMAVRPAIGEPPASGELPTADRFVVYFDYVEDGRLQGGRRVLDRKDPRVQEDFGLGLLDEVDRYRRANNQMIASQTGNYV